MSDGCLNLAATDAERMEALRRQRDAARAETARWIESYTLQANAVIEVARQRDARDRVIAAVRDFERVWDEGDSSVIRHERMIDKAAFSIFHELASLDDLDAGSA